MELHIDVLGCANLGAVNTYRSQPFYLAVSSGTSTLIFPFSLHSCQLQGLLQFSVTQFILLIAEILY